MKAILPAIENRRSTRAYTDEMPDGETLGAILEAARMAPSGKNTRKNRIYVLRSGEAMETLNRALIEAIRRGHADGVPANPTFAENGLYHFAYRAPIFLITTHCGDPYNALADGCCLLENAMIQAEALGVGSCFINTVRRAQNDPQVKALLASYGMQDGETVTGGLSLGYAAGENPRKASTDGNEVVFVGEA